jgi:hypothetical protein
MGVSSRDVRPHVRSRHARGRTSPVSEPFRRRVQEVRTFVLRTNWRYSESFYRQVRSIADGGVDASLAAPARSSFSPGGSLVLGAITVGTFRVLHVREHGNLSCSRFHRQLFRRAAAASIDCSKCLDPRRKSTTHPPAKRPPSRGATSSSTLCVRRRGAGAHRCNATVRR